MVRVLFRPDTVCVRCIRCGSRATTLVTMLAVTRSQPVLRGKRFVSVELETSPGEITRLEVLPAANLVVVHTGAFVRDSNARGAVTCRALARLCDAT